MFFKVLQFLFIVSFIYNFLASAHSLDQSPSKIYSEIYLKIIFLLNIFSKIAPSFSNAIRDSLSERFILVQGAKVLCYLDMTAVNLSIFNNSISSTIEFRVGSHVIKQKVLPNSFVSFEIDSNDFSPNEEYKCCFVQEIEDYQPKCSTLTLLPMVLNKSGFKDTTFTILYFLVFIFVVGIAFLGFKLFIVCFDTLRLKALYNESSDAALNRNGFQGVFSLGCDTLQIFEPYNLEQCETQLAMPPSYEECCIICANKDIDLKY